MSQAVAGIRDKRNSSVAFTRKLLDTAAAENRALTPEEKTQFEKADAEIDGFNDTINKAEKQEIREQWLKESSGVQTRNDPGSIPDDIKDKQAERRENAMSGAPKEVSDGFYGSDLQMAVDNSDSFRALAAKTETKGYHTEIRGYLRDGIVGPEMRALQADSDAAGGFTVPTQQFANQLIQAVHDQVFVLGLATNYTVTRAESLGAPALNTQMSNAQWGTELAVNVGGADTALNFGRRELRPHPLVNEILVSKKLIRTSAVDVEALVRDQMAYHFAVPLEQAFLQGSGANQPLGVFTADVNGITTGRDFVSAASSALITSSGADELLEVKFALKGNYWPRAVWILNRFHFKQVRQLKDANSQYLWSPGGFGVGVSNGQPDRLLDFPIYMSEYAPQSTAGYSGGSSVRTQAADGSTGAISGYVAICGDFSRYWTATALDMTIQVLTELKAETNQNAYLGRMEVDGMPVIAEAFSRYALKSYA